MSDKRFSWLGKAESHLPSQQSNLLVLQNNRLIQYLVIIYNGKESEKEYICFCCTREANTTL